MTRRLDGSGALWGLAPAPRVIFGNGSSPGAQPAPVPNGMGSQSSRPDESILAKARTLFHECEPTFTHSRDMRCQPLSQLGPSPSCLCPLDRDRQRLALPDQDDQTLASRYSRVDQVPLQHRVMLHGQRDHDSRVLRTLAFVDRRRVGEHQFVEFAKTVDDLAALEVDRDLALLDIDAGNEAEVAVVDFPVVVVLDLHDLVAQTEGPAEALNADLARRV